MVSSSTPLSHPPSPLSHTHTNTHTHTQHHHHRLTMCTRQEAAISPVGTVEYMAPEVGPAIRFGEPRLPELCCCPGSPEADPPFLACSTTACCHENQVRAQPPLPTAPTPQVVALPPVEAVVGGQIRAADIAPNTEKVDIWALGVTLFELVTGTLGRAARPRGGGLSSGLKDGRAAWPRLWMGRGSVRLNQSGPNPLPLLNTGRLPFEGRDKAEIKGNIAEYRMAGFGSHVTAQVGGWARAVAQGLPRRRVCFDAASQAWLGCSRPIASRRWSFPDSMPGSPPPLKRAVPGLHPEHAGL